jgi:hypothetical protein
VILVELLGLVYASFLFMTVWLFVLMCRTLKWVQKYRWPMRGLSWAHKCWSARGMSGYESAGPIKDMIYSSSVGTLTPLE